MKKVGYDDISVNVVKRCQGELLRPLQHIFSICFNKGCFPDQMKVAKVTPIFKSGNPEVINNYRPISILPCFSKILECIIFN